MTLSYERSALLDGFSGHYKALVRYLRRRTGNDEVAQELAHDTWLRLAEHAATKKSDGHGAAELASATVRDPRAYLYSVAANLDLDRLRRVKWVQSHLQESASTGALSQNSPDVAEQVMYRQALAAVEAALGGLPERGRQVWRACRINGESQPAVAARFSVALNTIERDLMAADRRVEAALRRWRGESPAEVASAACLKTSGTRRKGLVSLLAFAGLSTTGTLLWKLWQEQAQHWQAAYASPRGRGLVQPLPDGSVLTLDADSRAEFIFNSDLRTVHLLHGAAFFAVQHDAQRPFVVQADDVVVTVLGTRFGVDLAGNGNVLVQVESGRVQVAHAGSLTVLGAGKGLRVTSGGNIQPISGSAATWRTGVLHFDARPLGEVVERLARYARFELRVDAVAAPQRISGQVEIAHAADWLKSLPSVLPVRIVREDGGIVRIAAR